MKLSESLFRNETLPEAPRREDARGVRDTLFAGLVLIGIIAIAIDLAVRASDPYDIQKPRQRIAPVGGINTDTAGFSVFYQPKAQGVAVTYLARDHSALASPTSFPASFAGSIATRSQIEQEVISPVPAGGTERAAPVLVQTAPEQSGAEKVMA